MDCVPGSRLLLVALRLLPGEGLNFLQFVELTSTADVIVKFKENKFGDPQAKKQSRFSKTCNEGSFFPGRVNKPHRTLRNTPRPYNLVIGLACQSTHGEVTPSVKPGIPARFDY